MKMNINLIMRNQFISDINSVDNGTYRAYSWRQM